MSWRGVKGGIAAAQMGRDVVMTPTKPCYFDYRQIDSPDTLGAAWSPVVALRDVYAFEPTPPELTSEQAAHILGGQANVWTEPLRTPADVEFMVFPRMCALSEVVWTPRERRDWDSFWGRLVVQRALLDALHINYCPAEFKPAK